MAVPLLRGAHDTANLGEKKEGEGTRPRKHYPLEGCDWGPPECPEGIPTFHNNVGVILQQALFWNEAPCLLPALQPRSERKN